MLSILTAISINPAMAMTSIANLTIVASTSITHDRSRDLVILPEPYKC